MTWPRFYRSARQLSNEIEMQRLSEDLQAENETPTAEDNAAHAPGKTCAYCGKDITASQDARLLTSGDWVHDGCHRLRP